MSKCDESEVKWEKIFERTFQSKKVKEWEDVDNDDDEEEES